MDILSRGGEQLIHYGCKKKLDGTIETGFIEKFSKKTQRQGNILVVFRVDFRSTQNQKFTDLTMTFLTRAVESSPSPRGAKKN
jgi:hypothetical protein